MATYDLSILCSPQTYTISVRPDMSVNEIIKQISSRFNMDGDLFFLEIYDQRIQAYVDFDDRYHEELRQRLPKAYKETLLARIKFLEANDNEEVFHPLDNLLLSPDTSAESPIGISTMDDQRQIDADTGIDSELFVFSNTLPVNDINSRDDLASINHIIFVRDVIPYEKDEYSLTTLDESEAKGFRKDRRVKRIQGLKSSEDKRYAYVLPEIKIPSQFLCQNGCGLIVAVVLEELNGDQIIWRLHKLKGFLPDGTGTDAIPLNPFHLNIEKLILTTNGHYRLPLRICSLLEIPSVKTDGTIFHTLDATTVYHLHCAEHTPNIPRLACAIVDKNNTIQWETFGLSNFIRPIALEKSKFTSEKLVDLPLPDAKETTAETVIDPVATSKLLIDAPTVQPNFTNVGRHNVHNFVVVWLDSTIDVSSNDFLNSLVQLQSVVNVLNIFTDADECIDFLTDIHEVKAFMIVSGSLGQRIIPLIHNVPELHSIYIFCENRNIHEQLANYWPTVKGVFIEITDICKSLEQATHQCDQNNIPISFLSTTKLSNQHLNELDQSFMYTLLMKEILLEIDYNEQSIKELCLYFREQYADNHDVLSRIAKLEREYHQYPPIWWYTSSYFLYSVLNRALRILDVSIIIKMGFFIRDLYCQIKHLHSTQSMNNELAQFIVYRGQGLQTTDFEKMTKTEGGLMSFNNFLSTSKDQSTSLIFAETSQNDSNLVGVLFKITVNSILTLTPYANLTHDSYYSSEEEVLFSMHTVFRIGRITEIDNNGQLWQVELTLTSDNDPDLHAVTERIREETSLGPKGWHRLGILLTKIGQFEKAEQLCRILLGEAFNDAEKTFLYCQLGIINDATGNYKEAISFHGKALQIAQDTLSSDNPWFATQYNNITQVYLNMGEYSNALSFCEKALESQQKFLSSDHPDFATSYVKLGLIYCNIGDYSNSLSSYKEALEIQQLSLPPNHPNLAESYNRMGHLCEQMGEYTKALLFLKTSFEICQKILPEHHPEIAVAYNSIASVYLKMGDYAKALSLYEQAHIIRQKALPSNHPYTARSLNNIGSVYNNMGEYSKAISYYEKALEIQQQSLSSDHPNLAFLYNNIGSVYRSIGEYSKGLSYYEKAIQIQQRSLPPNHPDLASSYNNIAKIYYHIGNYSEAISYHMKALEIREKTLPAYHPNLASSYNNIGTVYYNMGDYPKALSSHEKALAIKQQSLPPNHPDLAMSYNNIGAVYQNMGDYPKALASYEKALTIRQQSLPLNHPDLAMSYSNIGEVYQNMGDYPKALLSYEKSLAIRQQLLPLNHLDLASSYNNIGNVYQSRGDYPKALSSYEKSIAIQQQSLPPNHPDLAMSYNNIGEVYRNMGDYPKAIASYEKSLAIQQQSLPTNHPHLASSYNNIGNVYQGMSDYPKALASYEKSFAIRQQSLPPNHPHLASSYNNIGNVYQSMGDYPKALASYDKAFAIQQQSLPPNHPSLGTSHFNIGLLYEEMGNYSKACSSYELGVQIGQKSLPSNHPDLRHYQTVLANIKKKL